MDYWNIDVNIFENKKVRLIRGEFGIKGVYIFLLILNEIYRTSGYYKKWDRDDCLLMSESSGMAGDCSPTLIAEVVSGLVRRSLLDQGVYDRFGVLTSKEIQRRFLRIVGNSRDSIPIVQEYFLLDPSNRKDVTRATLAKLDFFSISSKDSAENLKVDGENLKDLDKEKNRTEEKRKEQNPVVPGPSSDDSPVPVFCLENPETWGFGEELAQALSQWLAYKKEGRQVYTETSLKNLLPLVRESVEQYGEDALSKLIRQCISNGWAGIAWDKLKRPGESQEKKGDVAWMKKYIQQRGEDDT